MKTLSLYLILLVFLIGCEKEEDLKKPDQCSLLPDPGPCKAYIPKYYFDKDESKCKEFIWGGCDGVVPFNTMEECEQCERTKSSQ